MDITELSFKIVGGPTRDLIYKSTEHVFDKGFQIPLNFKLSKTCSSVDEKGSAYQLTGIKDFRNFSIVHSTNCGKDFILRGDCKVSLGNQNFTRRRYKIFYNTERQDGVLVVYIE